MVIDLIHFRYDYRLYHNRKEISNKKKQLDEYED